MTRPRRFRPLILPTVLVLLAAAGIGYAQLEGAERGIPPVDSASAFEVGGIEVDVVGENAQAARIEGWRRAQGEGWKLLWSRSRNRPASEAPALSESVLSSIVSGIIIEHEQIGPRRYIARLGLLFDRGRTGPMLGVQAHRIRSAPMLVIPVLVNGGTGTSFEYRNDWQAAWARFRTVNSPIDYVRTSGTGSDPLLLNAGQSGRRSRGWWHVILNQYGARDVLIPEVQLRRTFPGGPAIATFTAKRGADGEVLGRFQLRAPDAASLPRILDEGVRRIDAFYVAALEAGNLTPDPSLYVPRPQPVEPPERDERTADVPTAGPNAPVPAGTARTVRIQFASPDAAAVQRAEISVSRVSGVTSALTVSQAIGGVSSMRVTFQGDPEALAAALRAQGWTVAGAGTTLRISR